MCATYKDKQKRSHFESFANKIYTGIREIKAEYAEKRAIWELFQNALDTVTDNGIIEIAKTDRGFLFKHNGRPFRDDEFGGLIKQFSVGKTYGDNTDKLGQYGTGFISTHVYGKKIFINGSIQTDDNTYRTLIDFELDRDAVDIENLTDKLLDQDEFIEKLCDELKESEVLPLPFTTFEYQASESNRSHIEAMLGYVKSILPYIFCFNDKLAKVTVLHDGSSEEYVRLSITDGMAHLSLNQEYIDITVIKNAEGDIRIIMGTADRIVENIPKQFLFYPLMETSNSGYNFLIHANNFKPNKERDYLHKDHRNVELIEDVRTNEEILGIAFDLVLSKIISDEHISIMDIAKLEFGSLDSDFEKDLKRNYIDKIRELDRLDYNQKIYSLSSLQYFDDSVLLLDLNVIVAIYEILCQFLDLPSFEEFCELSKYVNNWNYNIVEKFNTLSLETIGQLVEEKSSGNYYNIENKDSYKVYISQISQNISLLNKLALIPNIHGEFKHFEDLVKWESSEFALVSIIDNVNLAISQKYVHKDFESLENFTLYNREKFKDDFSKFCNDLGDIIQKEKFSLSSVRFSMLVSALTDFVALNKKTQLNIDISTFFVKVFNLKLNPDELTEPTVDTNYQPAFKLLANLYLKQLDSNEIQTHVGDLKEILSIMFKNTNLKEELLHKLVCVPNQNYVLKSQTELKRDAIKDEEFKDVYDETLGAKIRNDLALDGFELFLQHPGSVSGQFIGEAIETCLNNDKRFIPVVTGTLDKVLKLIEKISEKPLTWGQWLPNINKVKEEVLMHKFQNEKTRSSLFSILTQKLETIELLGDLAKIENLADLVKKGKEKVKEENRNGQHLNYINYIGLTIQALVQNQLGIELKNTVFVLQSEQDKKLNTQEEQNGQDFIIYKADKPIYYIEVKSKWDENGRFALSKNQTEKCAAKKDQYAVISVNVDRYKRKYSLEIDNIPFEDLKEFVRVNDNLGAEFEKLVKENNNKVELSDPKLIEFRGSIPQVLIDETGLEFDAFVTTLIEKIKAA